MPPTPSLTDAFSALGRVLNVPPTSSFSGPGAFAPPNRVASPFSIPRSGPATPSLSGIFGAPAAQQPATQVPNASTPFGPRFFAPPVPSLSPSAGASSIAPQVQSQATLQGTPLGRTAATTVGYTPSPIATGNSGIQVDPNTGGVVAQPQVGGVTAAGGGPVGTLDGQKGTAPAVPSFADNPLISNPQFEAASRAFQAASTPSQEEINALTRLNQLTASQREAFVNTENQPIPLDFITGQKAAIQRSESALAAPLEAQLNIAQAKRQLAMNASKTTLDIESAKLAGVRELAKPISTTYGGTLSRYNPQTGQYETVVNPFGTADKDSSGTSVTDAIGSAMAEGRLSADQVTRYGIPFIAATLQKDPQYNFITQKASVGADTASLKTQQSYADTVSRSFSTAQDNLKQLIGFMQAAGVNAGSNNPLVNDLQNAVKAKLVDPGVIAGYKAAIQGLRSEYAQVLARGGEVTDNARNSAATLIPDNLTAAQIQQVADRLNVEGTNAIKEATDKVTQIKGRIKSNPGGSGSAPAPRSATSADPLGIL